MSASLLRRLQLLVWSGLLLAFDTLTIEARPITWTLSEVKLEDGTSVTGSFIFDASTFVNGARLTNFQISISGGSVIPALLYTPSNPLTSLIVELRRNSAGNVVESVDAFGDRSPATPRLEFVFLVPATSLSDEGGTIPLQLTDSNAQLNDGEVTVARMGAVSGAVIGSPPTAVPEPSGRGGRQAR